MFQFIPEFIGKEAKLQNIDLPVKEEELESYVMDMKVSSWHFVIWSFHPICVIFKKFQPKKKTVNHKITTFWSWRCRWVKT